MSMEDYGDPLRMGALVMRFSIQRITSDFLTASTEGRVAMWSQLFAGTKYIVIHAVWTIVQLQNFGLLRISPRGARQSVRRLASVQR